MELDATAPANRNEPPSSRAAGEGGFDVDHLVTEIQAGRSIQEGFRLLFEHYAAPVTHFFVNRGLTLQEAEDLTQDAFFRVYTSIGEFRRQASFETWLFQIAGNAWKNTLRYHGTLKRTAEEVSVDDIRDQETREPDSHDDDVPEDPQAGPLDRVLADERAAVLDSALDELPPKMKECVLLRIGQGLKYREIAALMKISIATVKSQLNAAQQRLKPLLEPHGEVFF